MKIMYLNWERTDSTVLPWHQAKPQIQRKVSDYPKYNAEHDSSWKKIW